MQQPRIHTRFLRSSRYKARDSHDLFCDHRRLSWCKRWAIAVVVIIIGNLTRVNKAHRVLGMAALFSNQDRIESIVVANNAGDMSQEEYCWHDTDQET
jgi:hypothetical protein